MSTTTQNRRNDPRLAGRGPVQAVVIDQHDQPVVVMRHAEAINISAGGMMLASTTPVTPGDHINVSLPDPDASRNPTRQAHLQALECQPWQDNLYRIRCQAHRAAPVPAELIYNW